MVLSLIFSIVVGIALGITGAGGGIIAIPVLMYSMQWDLLTAGPVALIAIACGASVGTIQAYRKQLVDLKVGFIMAFAGMPMAPIGQWLAKQIPTFWLLNLFIVVLIMVASRMWLSAKKSNNVLHKSHNTMPSSETSSKTAKKSNPNYTFALIGAIAGFMTGLLSVGGGFIIVPLLKHFTALTMKQASATSLLVIAIVSSTGVVSAVHAGSYFPMPFTLWFSITVVIGLIVGRYIGQYLSDRWIQRIFALFLLFIAGFMAYQNHAFI